MRYGKMVIILLVLAFCFTAFTAESATPPAPGKVTKVTVSASSPIPIDNSELRYDLTGSITVDGPAIVTYYWMRSDIKVPDSHRITFNSAGTQNVTSQLRVVKTGQVQHLWVEIKITNPNQVISRRLTITVPAAK
mgnify:CR=1 FL=1